MAHTYRDGRYLRTFLEWAIGTNQQSVLDKRNNNNMCCASLKLLPLLLSLFVILQSKLESGQTSALGPLGKPMVKGIWIILEPPR